MSSRPPNREIILSDSDIARFWKFVTRGEPNQCWEYSGVRYVKGGYGKFWLNGRDVKAHRVVYQLEVEELVPGLELLHTCDNPPYCNPMHLFQGTHRENIIDATDKGRMRLNKQGERASGAKLTEEHIRAIRAAECSAREIAAAFGMAVVSIHAIRRKASWKHI